MMGDWNSLAKALSRLEGGAAAHWQNYLGFYSSWLDGYFREPWAMTLPLDDHGFHRGDGVFEAVRIHQRAYIDLGSHLRRLQTSAAAIGMTLPKTLDEIESICVQLARLCDSDSGVLRLFVTRGPGSFTPNPREVVGHQVYAAITKMRLPDARFYTEGCRTLISAIPAKEQRWSRIKSCNYLQNVMMKKECVEQGYDMSLSVDEAGRVCEGATENLLVVTADGQVKVPRFDYTLRGTTVVKVMDLANELSAEGLVRSVGLADLTVNDVRTAGEVAFVGTTIGVLPVRELSGHMIGTGKPGPVTTRLQDLLIKKMSSDPSLRTPF